MSEFDFIQKHTFGLPITHRGVRQGKNKLGIYVMKIHYTADPDKRSKEWLAMAKEGVPDRDWNQEMEMIPVPVSGKPVYGAQWDPQRHELPAPHIFQPEWPTYVVWDFGYHCPVASMFQEDPDERAIWFKSIVGEDTPLDKFMEEDVKPQLLLPHQTAKGNRIVHYCDPAGKHKSDKGRTSLDILQDYGIYGIYNEEPQWRLVPSGVKLVLKMLTGRMEENTPAENWIPSLMVDPFNNPEGVDTMALGYRYPEAAADREEKDEPLKDGYYDNLADTMRYYAINRQPIHFRPKKKTRRRRPRYQPRRQGSYIGA